MKIAFFEIEQWERDVLQTALPGYALSFYPEPLRDNALSSVADTETLSTLFIQSFPR